MRRRRDARACACRWPRTPRRGSARPATARPLCARAAAAPRWAPRSGDRRGRRESAPLSISLFRSLLVAAMHAHVDLDGLAAADALDLALLQHAQHLGLRATASMSPISSRNSVPPCACSNLPRRCCVAPVKAPFSWPNSSLSMSSPGMAAQLSFTNGPSLRLECSWMARAISSLPVPRSPVMSTRPVDGAALRDGLEDALHARPSCRPCSARACGAARRAALSASRSRRASLSAFCDGDEHLVGGQRLLEKIAGAELGRLDGGGERGVARHHHHRQLGAQLAQRLERGQAVHLRHGHVEQHGVEGARRALSPARCARSRRPRRA